MRERTTDHSTLHPGTLRDRSLIFAVLGAVLLHDLS
jgi:hypothetical protein